MNRLAGKSVLITGASAGIGAACARAFAEAGCHLILSARRKERIDRLGEELHAAHGVNVARYGLDVRNRSSVEAFARGLVDADAVPDILVNNAGLARGLHSLHEGEVQDWEEMIDTNVKGLLYVSRAIVPAMVERDSGHVIQIGSIAGRQVYPMGNVYNATKFAVRALNQGMNVDLAGTGVRVSSVDPGLVETEFSEVRFRGDTARAADVYRGLRALRAEDIADAVVYVANAPDHVTVHEMLILPTDQRNAYVLHRTDT